MNKIEREMKDLSKTKLNSLDVSQLPFNDDSLDPVDLEDQMPNLGRQIAAGIATGRN